MIHVYKLGGDRIHKDGFNYSIEAINPREFELFSSKGWHKQVEDCQAIEADFSKDDTHEKSLREQIKQLGGTPAGRSSVARLESQLEELKNDDTNEG